MTGGWFGRILSISPIGEMFMIFEMFDDIRHEILVTCAKFAHSRPTFQAAGGESVATCERHSCGNTVADVTVNTSSRSSSAELITSKAARTNYSILFAM